MGALPPEVQQQIQQLEQQCQQQLAQLQQTVTVEQVDDLFKNQRMRPFALEVETDSTIEPDRMAAKQQVAEFITAMGPLLDKAVMAMQVAPQLGEFTAELIRYAAGAHDMPRSMDDAIDKLAEGFANYQPPPQGEDPQIAQAQLQAEMVKAQAAQAKGEADIQIAQMKAQIEQAKMQAEQFEGPKTQAETEKLQAETQKILMETQAIPRELEMQADQNAQQNALANKTADAKIAHDRDALSVTKSKTDADIAKGQGELNVAKYAAVKGGQKTDADIKKGEVDADMAQQELDMAGVDDAVEGKKKKRVFRFSRDPKTNAITDAREEFED